MSKNADTGPAMAVVKANRELEAAPLCQTYKDPVPELAVCEIPEGSEPSVKDMHETQQAHKSVCLKLTNKRTAALGGKVACDIRKIIWGDVFLENIVGRFGAVRTNNVLWNSCTARI
jgi:hypothetical protein